MRTLNSVAVFCGASPNVPQHFLDENYKLGGLLAELGLTMVYGGARCGTMGAAANGALEKGGEVIGVFPVRILDNMEQPHHNLTELIISADMHSRKITMFEKSDLFIISPGGFGTMDEAYEIITLKYLGVHNKPIIFYNYRNYYDIWKQLTDKFIEEKFTSTIVAEMYEFCDSLEEIATKLKNMKEVLIPA